MLPSRIITVVTRKLFPFILLFGLYLVSYGHLSPGGGFQGGVAIASAVVLLSLSQGIENTKVRFREKTLGLIESGGVAVLTVIGLVGIGLGTYFLENFIPGGAPEKLAGGGILPFLNLVLGIKVGAAFVLIFYYLWGEERSE